MDLPNCGADQHVERETAALELETLGDAVITVGEALLGMDLILICFVEIGLRTGSNLFLWWVIVEGVAGLILVAIGLRHKSKARKQLKTLEPPALETL